MDVGVSTACLYPMETEGALQLLLDAGVKNLEVFVNTFSEMEPAYLGQLRSMAQEQGARILSLHPFSSGLEGYLFFTDYPRRTREALELYKRYFEGVQLLGGDIVVFHGAGKGSTMTAPQYAERFATMVETAKSCGARLCHENVSRTVSWTPELFRALRAGCPQAEFVLDIKQAVRAQVDPFDMLEAMGDRVAHVHISDHAPGQSCLPPGRGAMDTGRLLRELARRGYRGALIEELYRDNFGGVEDLVAGEEFLARCLKNL